MIINKTKEYDQLSLSEVKAMANIDSGDFQYDGILKRFLEVATGEAEDYVQNDIVSTESELIDENYYFTCSVLEYLIPITNVSITSVKYSVGFQTTTATTLTLSAADYNIERHSSYTVLRFKNTVTFNKLMIEYSSGYSAIPQQVKNAIYLRAIEYFDANRNGYVSNQIINSKAFERALSPHINSVC